MFPVAPSCSPSCDGTDYFLRGRHTHSPRAPEETSGRGVVGRDHRGGLHRWRCASSPGDGGLLVELRRGRRFTVADEVGASSVEVHADLVRHVLGGCRSRDIGRLDHGRCACGRRSRRVVERRCRHVGDVDRRGGAGCLVHREVRIHRGLRDGRLHGLGRRRRCASSRQRRVVRGQRHLVGRRRELHEVVLRDVSHERCGQRQVQRRSGHRNVRCRLGTRGGQAVARDGNETGGEGCRSGQNADAHLVSFPPLRVGV